MSEWIRGCWCHGLQMRPVKDGNCPGWGRSEPLMQFNRHQPLQYKMLRGQFTKIMRLKRKSFSQLSLIVSSSGDDVGDFCPDTSSNPIQQRWTECHWYWSNYTSVSLKKQCSFCFDKPMMSVWSAFIIFYIPHMVTDENCQKSSRVTKTLFLEKHSFVGFVKWTHE